jgi:hypothetical protein
MAADVKLSLGVIVERRDSEHPWQSHGWRPVAVIAEPPPGAPWRELRQGPGWIHYHAATLDLELFRSETEGYRTNLSQDVPRVFVALRPGEGPEEHDVEPFLVTACPFEAMGYSESGDEIVEGVAMPSAVIARVQAFVDAHHVEVPFKKRKNKRHRDEGLGSRPRGRRSRRQA